MTKRMALFGGSFDPVHHGHLIIARTIAEHRGFERITFMPAGAPPHKPPPVAPAGVRLEMLRAAIVGNPLFDVCDLETRRGGPSYTIDTLEELRRLRGRETELFWIIGADMLKDLHLWRRACEVVDAAQILTAMRPPWDQRMPSLLACLREHFSPAQVARLEQGVVQTPVIDISSSEIRRRAADGLPLDYLAPREVLDVIRERLPYDNRLS
jgi:nicotinate-nucleotide adenylyltransferase